MTTYTCGHCRETMEVDEKRIQWVNGVAEVRCSHCGDFYVIHRPESAGFGGKKR